MGTYIQYTYMSIASKTISKNKTIRNSKKVVYTLIGR